MLEAGARLGPDATLGSLGAGSMGEVDRAAETTHGREAALVSPKLSRRTRVGSYGSSARPGFSHH